MEESNNSENVPTSLLPTSGTNTPQGAQAQASSASTPSVHTQQIDLQPAASQNNPSIGGSYIQFPTSQNNASTSGSYMQFQLQQNPPQPNPSQTPSVPFGNSNFPYNLNPPPQQQPQNPDPQLWGPQGIHNGYYPTLSPHPPQPTPRQPRFKNVVEAWSQHLMKPGWRPSTGIYGMPLNETGGISDEGMQKYVVQLYNAFIDVSAVFDTHNHRHFIQHFLRGGAYVKDCDDIEAVCHVIVGAASYLHTHGVISLAYKRMPHRAAQLTVANFNQTFAQRIWLLGCLVKHYKYHADALLRTCLVEEYLVGVWNILMSTDFRQRLPTWSEEARRAWQVELRSLGIPTMQPGPATMVGTTGAHTGFVMNRPQTGADGRFNTPQAVSAQLYVPNFSEQPVVSNDPQASLEEIIRQRSAGIRNNLHMPNRLEAPQSLPASATGLLNLEMFNDARLNEGYQTFDTSGSAGSNSFSNMDLGFAMPQNLGDLGGSNQDGGMGGSWLNPGGNGGF